MQRIEREKQTLQQMIELYCRHKEKNTELCDNCKALMVYAYRHLDLCRYGDHKGSCKECSTHCYAPLYRAKIREVMRYAGPRMLLCHPINAIRHLLNI